ncbi:EF-hand calcium-binding domain-containing protein 1 [Cladochytrium tenue]|nr:EF-hand calcium-binding domain-containing protein 1 [Cladochytrium tenue]
MFLHLGHGGNLPTPCRTAYDTLDFVYEVFRCFDLDADNYISFDEFVKGMSVFLKGRGDEQLKFCFRVYDLNGDRYISKEEMFQMLKNCLVKGAEEDEDGVKDLVDLVLKKLDEDRDGRVSEADWAGVIAKEALLMEAFGQCLPSRKSVEAFLEIDPDSSGSGGAPGSAAAVARAASSSSSSALAGPGRGGARVVAGSAAVVAGGMAAAGVAVPQLLGRAAAHAASKHVHPHARHGPRRVVVAPASGAPSAVQSASPTSRKT